MKPRILVIGSSNTDMIAKVPRLPSTGETILGGEFVTAAGGKGANQAVAAARVGGDVTFVASVGKDMFGDQALAGFKADGIQTQYIRRDKKAPSGVALIFVAKNGANCIAVAFGANAQLSARDIRQAAPAFTEAQIVVAQLETPLPTVLAAAKLAARQRVPFILNPAPAQALPPKLLRLVTILTPNETEAELLTGIKVTTLATANRAAEKLLARGVRTVIITLGARGAFVAHETLRKIVPGFRMKAVDTTAAGDVFNGALAVALAEGRELLTAVRFANAAAALSVTKLGAQPSAPRRAAVEKLLSRQGFPSFSYS